VPKRFGTKPSDRDVELLVHAVRTNDDLPDARDNRTPIEVFGAMLFQMKSTAPIIWAASPADGDKLTVEVSLQSRLRSDERLGSIRDTARVSGELEQGDSRTAAMHGWTPPQSADDQRLVGDQ